MNKVKKNSFEYYVIKGTYYRRKIAFARQSGKRIRTWIYNNLYKYYEKQEIKAFMRGD